MPNWKSSIGRMRLTGMMEGASFLLLTGVAMPLKYLAGMPGAVRYAGWLHGVLFIGYCVAIYLAFDGGKITFRRSVTAFVAALIPFGPFVIDGKLAADGKSGDAG